MWFFTSSSIWSNSFYFVFGLHILKKRNIWLSDSWVLHQLLMVCVCCVLYAVVCRLKVGLSELPAAVTALMNDERVSKSCTLCSKTLKSTDKHFFHLLLCINFLETLVLTATWFQTAAVQGIACHITPYGKKVFLHGLWCGVFYGDITYHYHLVALDVQLGGFCYLWTKPD